MAQRPGYEACIGCRLCVLPCPVWRQTSDISLTLAGRAKALQRGASPQQLAQSLEACVLCGACEPVCPVDIDTVGMTLQLRARLMESGGSAFAPASALIETDTAITNTSRANAWFLPGRSLRADSKLRNAIVSLLEKQGTRLAEDDGTDLAIALEAGYPISSERRTQFAQALAGSQELIAGEGLLHRVLREWLPGIRVIGLGEALLRLAPVRSALRPTDMYVIETRAYHAEFARLVRLYDQLRKEVGCSTNLDLLRSAIPTGANSLQTLLGHKSVDSQEQAQWILEGRKVQRIVVEDPADQAVFEAVAGLPVVHLSELANGATT